MSRTLSTTLQQAIFGQETSEVFIILLTISHTDLESPIRLCSNGVDVTSNGDLYQAFPFILSLPEESADRPPRASLQIDNIDRTIIAAIRSITTPPTVKMDIILASDFDTVEISIDDFKMRNITYNAFTVEGDLNIEGFTSEPYPSGRFIPSVFPALF